MSKYGLILVETDSYECGTVTHMSNANRHGLVWVGMDSYELQQMTGPFPGLAVLVTLWCYTKTSVCDTNYWQHRTHERGWNNEGEI